MPEEQSKAVNQDQARALQAWFHIGDPANAERVKIKDGWSGDYKSLVKSFPAMILTNGIGQALAFLRAKGKYGQPDENKGKPQHRALYKHISLWVTKEIYGGPTDQLMREIIQGTSDKYRRATTETLAFVAWLKRFAEAEIEREGTDSE